MSFFRHREIYRSDVTQSVRERRHHRARVHRFDEFPADYSLAGCTPALPASASPAGTHSVAKMVRGSRIFQLTANYALTVCDIEGVNRKTGFVANFTEVKIVRRSQE